MSQPARQPRSSAQRVADYRRRMREAGLVQKTIWVPDLTDPQVLAEIERECRVINASAESREVWEWIEAMQADLDLGPIPEYRLPIEK